MWEKKNKCPFHLLKYPNLPLFPGMREEQPDEVEKPMAPGFLEVMDLLRNLPEAIRSPLLLSKTTKPITITSTASPRGGKAGRDEEKKDQWQETPDHKKQDKQEARGAVFTIGGRTVVGVSAVSKDHVKTARVSTHCRQEEKQTACWDVEAEKKNKKIKIHCHPHLTHPYKHPPTYLPTSICQLTTLTFPHHYWYTLKRDASVLSFFGGTRWKDVLLYTVRWIWKKKKMCVRVWISLCVMLLVLIHEEKFSGRRITVK